MATASVKGEERYFAPHTIPSDDFAVNVISVSKGCGIPTNDLYPATSLFSVEAYKGLPVTPIELVATATISPRS